MIAEAVANKIRELLLDGALSQRKIARSVGVSRGTVNAIAKGKRPDYTARGGQAADDFIVPNGLPRRCPGWGGLVQMPCLACHVRGVRKRWRG